MSGCLFSACLLAKMKKFSLKISFCPFFGPSSFVKLNFKQTGTEQTASRNIGASAALICLVCWQHLDQLIPFIQHVRLAAGAAVTDDSDWQFNKWGQDRRWAFRNFLLWFHTSQFLNPRPQSRPKLTSFYLLCVYPCKFLMSGCRSYFYSSYRSEGGSHQDWTLWFHKNETMFWCLCEFIK